MNKSKIWLSSPHMGGSELKYVQEAFDTNWIAPLGANVDGFEEDIQHYLQEGHVAALISGTSALHLGLILLGVEAGDEVICQSMTFSASANPIAYLGANPIFINSERETWNMCPDALEEAIKDRIKKGKKPKVIIPVHLYGMPARMLEIMQVAQSYDIPILEDAAEALGSHIDGKKCGTFGEIAALSFNGNKIITTSGGGALVAKQKKIANQTRFLSTQARDNAPHYEHSNIGYNYRMSNVLAGIGRGQMEVIDDRVAQRRKNFELYRQAFVDIPTVSFLVEPDNYFSNRWLTTVLIDSPKENKQLGRERLRMHLASKNIESRPLWKPMHMQPVFKNALHYGASISEELFETGLCLPSGSNLSEKDVQFVIDEVRCCLLT